MGVLFKTCCATLLAAATARTPIQFGQGRTGFRLNDGISQDPSEHERLYFIELHGYS
ncbi:MAG: hypothetical protein ABSG29_02965 [Steroidobacteraceae bacterium]